jgi:choline dehydrogenase
VVRFRENDQSAFDFIIVGAGSAGCVLANRLSADGKHSVLLLEAGPKDSSPWIHIPAGLHKALANPQIEWGLATEAEDTMNGRRIPVPRGRTLGGSSSVNGMLYVRGQPDDYNNWASEGCPGWAWPDVLPYFRRSEANDRGEDEFHGAAGPLRVSSARKPGPLAAALIAAAEACQIPHNEDFNGRKQEGVGLYQYTVHKGRRQSTAIAFLRPALANVPRLDVRTEARVHRILFEDRRACGLIYSGRGRQMTVRARREIILSAGSIHSPQILMLSGIGPATALARHGIEVLAESQDVGSNLQDHLQVRLLYQANAPVSLNALARNPIRKAAAGLQYLARRGVLSRPPITCGLFARSEPSASRPDLQFHLLEFSSDGAGKPFHSFPGFFITVCPLRPESRGNISLKSPDPADEPAIRQNFLSADEDCRLTLAGIHLTRRLAATEPLKGLIQAELSPGPDAIADTALLNWARETAISVYHPVGTCRMGSDFRAVVDPQLRVRGVDGLRVVDGSIMPRLVSGNTNAPIIMIAEKAADMILADVTREIARQDIALAESGGK